jgi:MFS family permease
MLGLGALNVLFVPFVIGDLAVSEAFLGAVEASQVVGLVVSGMVVAALASRLRPATLVSLGLTALSLFVGFIAASQSVWQVMILLFFVGLSVGPVQAGASTLSQTLIEDFMRGRVGGAVSTVVSAANLTSMGVAGVAAATIGIRNVFLASGCLILLAGLLTLWLLREQRLAAPTALTRSVSEVV